MSGAESSLILLPKYTTLVGGSGESEFVTVPLDVSRYTSAQIETWRGAMGAVGGPANALTFSAYFEESLDTETWFPGNIVSEEGFDFLTENGDHRLFFYTFRLRWFRLRVKLEYSGGLQHPIVSCWAEGLLR